MRVVSILVCAALLSSCASSPTHIQASYVSPQTYASFNCDQIDTEIMAVDTRATDLYHRIAHRANGDAWKMGIGMLVAWPALLFLSGGNHHDGDEYAQLKGQKDALIAARRNCTRPAAIMATGPAAAPQSLAEQAVAATRAASFSPSSASIVTAATIAPATNALGEIPGTVHIGRLTLVPARTASGQCVIAPDDYIGTGAANMPAITSDRPRCDSIR